MTKYREFYPDHDKPMDECGVFGIYRNNDDLNVVTITHDALYSLQHRGHVSAGITVNDNRQFTTVKELGMVSEVFNDKTLAKLPNGKIAVGHVRYTMNAALDRAANQPLVLRYKEGSIAIASNGSITNFPAIRRELERGEYFTVSFFDEQYRSALSFCGSKSGRNVNKVQETGLTPAFTEEGVPYFEEARLVFFCKKLYAQPLNEESVLGGDAVLKQYNGDDYHKMYISEILEVMTK